MKERQPTILVPPGLGDIYWVMCKMEGFIETHLNGNTPRVFTDEECSRKPERSSGYLKRIPFIEYGGAHPGNGPPSDSWFGNTWLKPNYKGYDYYICVNGVLRNGNTLDSYGLDQYQTNWFYNLTPNDEEHESIEKYKSLFGEYIMAFFSNDGMYSHWLKQLPVPEIYELLRDIWIQTGKRIVLTGKGWDGPIATEITNLDIDGFIINYLDQTPTLDDLFAVIQGCSGVVGWCGGNTIKSTYYKKPTLMLWNDYFKHDGFFRHCVPPESVDRWYFWSKTNTLTPNIIKKFCESVTNGIS